MVTGNFVVLRMRDLARIGGFPTGFAEDIALCNAMQESLGLSVVSLHDTCIVSSGRRMRNTSIARFASHYLSSWRYFSTTIRDPIFLMQYVWKSVTSLAALGFFVPEDAGVNEL
jgi:hypothetical protein